MSKFKKIVANVLSTDFRKACQIVTADIPSLKKHEVLVKARYAGVNATDINMSAGRYGSPQPPFDVGLEGVGEIADVGDSVPKEMIGRPVGYICNGSYAEYLKLPAEHCIPIPEVNPSYIPLLISGLTASISLENFGRIKAGENVLITAAAGGTGHIAVQVAKQAGCHVIGTCSSEEKAKFLKSIGCDHVINYKTEDLSSVLKESYPKGIDVVYESVGGDIFNTCVERLAVKGRMVVIGFINSYHLPAGIDRSNRDSTLLLKLLMKSASVSGFFLMNHISDYSSHLGKLVSMLSDGKLKVLTDMEDSNGKRFSGLESVFGGVDYLYSRKSKGKVIIEIPHSVGSSL